MKKVIRSEKRIGLATGVLGILVAGTLVSGTILSSIKVSADTNDTVVDEVNISVPVACTLSGTVNTAHTKTVNNNTYEDEIGQTTLAAFCNDMNGFAIYAIGYGYATTSDYSNGSHTYGNNTLLGINTGSTIATGTNTSGNTSNWAMKLTKVTDTSVSYVPANLTIENGFGSYSNVPSTFTKVATYSSTTDQTLGARLTTTYAAFVSGTQVADTYEGAVKYTMVHPSTLVSGSYTISYNANGGSGSMASTTGYNFEDVTLLTNGFTAPSGYEFAGWCTVQGTATQTTCTGTSYSDEDEIPASTITSGGTLNLYAYWSALSMQSFNSTKCSNMTTGATMTLTDTRDGESYLIGKLADGNCWMLDNLRLDLTDTNVQANLSSSTTNATDLALGYLINGGGSSPYATTAVAEGTINSYIAPQIATSYKNTTTTSYGAGSGKIGVYYNYCAATAGSYCYASGSGTGNASYDICPAGWRMPTGGAYDDSTHTGTGEYYTLGIALGLTFDEDEWGFTGTTYQTALSTPLSGYYWGSSAGDQGDWGDWWSSTYNDGYGMYRLIVNSEYVNPNNGSNRSDGDSMRCLVGD